MQIEGRSGAPSPPGLTIEASPPSRLQPPGHLRKAGTSAKQASVSGAGRYSATMSAIAQGSPVVVGCRRADREREGLEVAATESFGLCAAADGFGLHGSAHTLGAPATPLVAAAGQPSSTTPTVTPGGMLLQPCDVTAASSTAGMPGGLSELAWEVPRLQQELQAALGAAAAAQRSAAAAEELACQQQASFALNMKRERERCLTAIQLRTAFPSLFLAPLQCHVLCVLVQASC